MATPYQQWVERNGGGPAFREPKPAAERFDVRAADRVILAQRLAWMATARWYVLNCEPACRAHNREGYRYAIKAARWWRTNAPARLGGR